MRPGGRPPVGDAVEAAQYQARPQPAHGAYGGVPQDGGGREHEARVLTPHELPSGTAIGPEALVDSLALGLHRYLTDHRPLLPATSWPLRPPGGPNSARSTTRPGSASANRWSP
jgi:hypothetical protein